MTLQKIQNPLPLKMFSSSLKKHYTKKKFSPKKVPPLIIFFSPMPLKYFPISDRTIFLLILVERSNQNFRQKLGTKYLKTVVQKFSEQKRCIKNYWHCKKSSAWIESWPKIFCIKNVSPHFISYNFITPSSNLSLLIKLKTEENLLTQSVSTDQMNQLVYIHISRLLLT